MPTILSGSVYDSGGKFGRARPSQISKEKIFHFSFFIIFHLSFFIDSMNKMVDST